MRTHVVGVGESPGSIAVTYVSCPKCSRDLVVRNAHKPRVVHRNGYVTFQSLEPGEVLALPEKWFEPWFEDLPPAYFASLPYADGATPSPFGAAAAEVISAYDTIAAAAYKIFDLVPMSDREFVASLSGAIGSLNASVQKVVNGSNPVAASRALTVQDRGFVASERNRDLVAALNAGDMKAVSEIRSDIQAVLATAISDARASLNTYYGDTQP